MKTECYTYPKILKNYDKEYKEMKVDESLFTIVSNGYADGPSQALRDYLIGHKSKRVVTIAHPLVPEGDNRHIIVRYEDNRQKKSIKKLFHKPPYTYAFDLVIPAFIPKDTIWFGFNNLACLRGLLRKKLGFTEQVVYWAVDFVPNRFGKGIATKVYNAVDKYVCKHVDFRVELSREGREGRDQYLAIDTEKVAPSIVIPMGAWLARTPKTNPAAWKRKRIVYMGHLVERQGVEHVIGALALIVKDDPGVSLDIVGGGPDLEKLKNLAGQLGLTHRNITFHGFVKDHRDVESILSQATIAVAPYAKLADSFTQTADPGKVKAYLGASLPIVITDVPPIAKEIEQCGAGVLVDDNAVSVALAIKNYLRDEILWQKARESSMKKAEEFDWEILLTNGLAQIGLKK